MRTLSDSQIEKLWIKRSKLLDKLTFYIYKMDYSNWNTRNYTPHRKRCLKTIHKINNILIKELDIDTRYIVL